MIRCMIVEDEPLARDILIKYIHEIPELELIGTAADGEEGMKLAEEQPVELLFLDINLPKLSGLNLFKSLPRKPRVIFTTAYPEYAVEGFELDAVDYLLKPFSFERFHQAVNKAKAALGQKEEDKDILIVREDKRTYRLPLDAIRYIEGYGDYVKIFSDQKTWIINETMKHLSDSLPENRFLRVHKSYIVSLDHIEYLEGNQLKIAGQMIPIGQAYRNRITAIFNR